MKKIIGLAAISLLLAACDRLITTVTFEFHQAATTTCEKNGGYEKFRGWTSETIGPDLNYHLVIRCNDGAEFHIKKVLATVNDVKTWGEWETDSQRFGTW